MRVICIDDSQFGIPHRHPHLKYMEVYEPNGERKNVYGEDCYVLSQFPPTVTRDRIMNDGPFYRKSRFVPLSEIDETEFERNYNKELV